jgi:hypothetical protein
MVSMSLKIHNIIIPKTSQSINVWENSINLLWGLNEIYKYCLWTYWLLNCLHQSKWCMGPLREVTYAYHCRTTWAAAQNQSVQDPVWQFWWHCCHAAPGILQGLLCVSTATHCHRNKTSVWTVTPSGWASTVHGHIRLTSHWSVWNYMLETVPGAHYDMPNVSDYNRHM